MTNSPFNYVTPPFNHQRNAFESTRDFQYFAFFWEMGLGKSKIIIDTTQWLFVNRRIDSLIITAEKGYYLNWMVDEFPKHWPSDIPVRIKAYQPITSKSKQDEFEKLLKPEPGVLDVLVLNIESISRKNMGGFIFAERFMHAHKSVMMVVDESTTIKNPKAGRTKQAIRLGRQCQYRRILTGTPITQSPIDVYSQCEFLKTGVLGFRSYTGFRNYYSVMQPLYLGNRTINQVVGYRELDDLTKRLSPISSRLLKKDCLDLPEKIYSTIHVEATDIQKQFIRKLSVEAMANINSGEITVTNALSILTKAQQIAGGHVKDDEGHVHRMESNKPQALADLVSSVPDDGKIIIWAYFNEDVRVIKEALNIPIFNLHAEQLPDERMEVVRQFKEHEGKCAFLSTPRLAGKSLSLNEARYVIYYSNGFNLEHRLQSEDRNHRIGQTGTVNYYDLICDGTPDVKVVAALRAKKNISDEVLDNLQSFFVTGIES